MISKDFFQCLDQERSIFRDFSSYSNIGDFQVFCSPGLSEIPHWNLAYPLVFSKHLPTEGELHNLKEYFHAKQLTGHLALSDKALAGAAAEESEYFAIQGLPNLDKDSRVGQMTHIESELEQFCDLIKISFSLSDETISYFKNKMAMLQKRPGTKFFIIKLQDKIVGGCSVFVTDNGASFMFNVATHPDVQGGGMAKEIIAYASKMSPKPLYTYSHNPIMRESILPRLGFTSLGTLWCVPLDLIRAGG